MKRKFKRPIKGKTKPKRKTSSTATKLAAPLPKGVEGLVKATQEVVKESENSLAGEHIGVCFTYTKGRKNVLKVPVEISGKTELITVSKILPVGVKEPKEGDKISFTITRNNGHYEALVDQTITNNTATNKMIRWMKPTGFTPVLLPLGHFLSILAREGLLLSNLPEDTTVEEYIDQALKVLTQQRGFEDYTDLKVDYLTTFMGKDVICLVNENTDSNDSTTTDGATDSITDNNDAATA